MMPVIQIEKMCWRCQNCIVTKQSRLCMSCQADRYYERVAEARIRGKAHKARRKIRNNS